MPEVIAADSTDFEDQVMTPENILVVVDFWGPQCPNCEVFAADLPRLLQALNDAPLRVVKVNAYQNAELARRFGLYGVPTFVLVRKGRVLGKMSQYRGFDFWLSVVREHLPNSGKNGAQTSGQATKVSR